MSRSDDFEVGRRLRAISEAGEDEPVVPALNTRSEAYKAVLRRSKGEQARASEGEELAGRMGYGMGDFEDLDAHLASHHGGGNVRNPAQSHMRYHLEYKNPMGPPHEH